MSIPASPRMLRLVSSMWLMQACLIRQVAARSRMPSSTRVPIVLLGHVRGAFNLGDNPQLKLLSDQAEATIADDRSSCLDAADAAHRHAAAWRQLARTNRQLLARHLMALGTIQIPFPDSTMPGTPGHFQESGGRIINSYLEPLGPAAPSTLIYRRAPGLRTFGTTVADRLSRRHPSWRHALRRASIIGW